MYYVDDWTIVKVTIPKTAQRTIAVKDACDSEEKCRPITNEKRNVKSATAKDAVTACQEG